VNSRKKIPSVGGAYASSNTRGVPPARSTLTSSMLSAPHIMAAMIVVSLPAGLTAPEAGSIGTKIYLRSVITPTPFPPPSMSRPAFPAHNRCAATHRSRLAGHRKSVLPANPSPWSAMENRRGSDGVCSYTDHGRGVFGRTSTSGSPPVTMNRCGCACPTPPKNGRTVVTSPECATRNRDFLEKLYLASFAGEVAAFPNAMASDFEAHVPPQLPWGGVHRGPDEFVNVVLPQLAVALDFRSMRLESISANCDRVAALMSARTALGTNIWIAEHWVIAGDKLQLLRVFYDDTRSLQSRRAIAAS
jgi:hypothetical protein